MITDWNELIKQEKIAEQEHKVKRLEAELELAKEELAKMKNETNTNEKTQEKEN